MKKFTADVLFTGTEFKQSHVLICDDKGTVIDLIHESEVSKDGINYHEGILSPGFINTHCHLELSHLKNKISRNTGLDGFIKEIEQHRTSEAESIHDAIISAENEMIENGIVAVGDISNGNNSFSVKKESRLYYHTFLEVFGFHPDRADQAFARGQTLSTELNSLGLKGSITPHAPYSASKKLLELISQEAYKIGEPLTIHMEESEDEDLLFMRKEGRILERLKKFGIDDNHFNPTGFTALRSTLIHLPVCNKLQLVHNTYTSKEDIQWAEDYHKLIYWCFCPKANLYIENTVPDFKLFYERGVKCTIGTDSLASNDSLDILDELRVINEYAPKIPVMDLLKSATTNGAEFLGISARYGTFEKGKMPGINLISGVDLNENRIAKSSRIHKLA